MPSPRVAVLTGVRLTGRADPAWNFDEALAPFRPLAMRTVHTPLDARLTAADANGLLSRVRPRVLCAPAARTHPPQESRIA